MIAETIATNLRKLREEKQMTQKDLAKKMRVSLPYVSMLESGARVPSARRLESLASALGVRPSDLLKEEGE